MITQVLFEIEQNIIPREKYEKWPKCIPNYVKRMYNREVALGVPTALAKYKGKYYLIQTSGQGPYIIWSENDN